MVMLSATAIITYIFNINILIKKLYNYNIPLYYKVANNQLSNFLMYDLFSIYPLDKEAV